MFSEDRWLLPEGVEEILPEEAERLEYLRRKVLDLFASWGYRQVMTPFIEYIESLLIGAGHDLDLQTFKLIDPVSGHLLGVRADMTPQVARIDARHAKGDAPSRLCYLGTVLHTQSDHLETTRSPLQVGAELYGHAGAASDLEIIRLMLAMFSIADMPQVHLDLGHVGVYRALALQADLNAAQEAALFDILQRKAAPDLQEFFQENPVAPASRRYLSALVKLHGDASVLAAARAQLADADIGVCQALDELETLAGQLLHEFPDMPIHFDLAELRGYHYQTGVVFAAFAEGYGRELARGGRYDEIGRAFGRARPATGFSADLKVLARLSQNSGEHISDKILFAPNIDDPSLQEAVATYRKQGWIVIRELPGQTAKAAEMGCHYELRRQQHNWEITPLSA
jgi:ATP phosphoribosyltransferase regulatory subunit